MNSLAVAEKIVIQKRTFVYYQCTHSPLTMQVQPQRLLQFSARTNILYLDNNFTNKRKESMKEEKKVEELLANILEQEMIVLLSSCISDNQLVWSFSFYKPWSCYVSKTYADMVSIGTCIWVFETASTYHLTLVPTFLIVNKH